MSLEGSSSRSIKEAVYSREKLYFDGDWDGFVAAALLYEAGFEGRGQPISPSESGRLMATKSVLIELPPNRIAMASDSVLFDHHGLGGIVENGIGFLAYVDDGRIRILSESGPVKSVAEAASKIMGIKAPEDLIRYTGNVDSDPKKVLDDPRYAGYKALIDYKNWKMWVLGGLRGVYRAMNLHRRVGEKILEHPEQDEGLIETIKHTVKCRGHSGNYYVIVCRSWKEEVVEGYHIKPALYLAKRRQIELEEKPGTLYVFIAYMDKPKHVSRFSISSGPISPLPANTIAAKMGGGGHPHVAGAPLNKNLDEATRIFEKLVLEACGGMSH